MEKSNLRKEKYSVKKYSRKNLKAVESIVEEKSGGAMVPNRKLDGHIMRDL